MLQWLATVTAVSIIARFKTIVDFALFKAHYKYACQHKYNVNNL